MVEVCKKSHFNSIFKANILDFGGFGNEIRTKYDVTPKNCTIAN